jgi:hypothetical protein
MWQTVNLGDAKISTAPLDERTAARTAEAPGIRICIAGIRTSVRWIVFPEEINGRLKHLQPGGASGKIMILLGECHELRDLAGSLERLG